MREHLDKVDPRFVFYLQNQRLKQKSTFKIDSSKISDYSSVHLVEHYRALRNDSSFKDFLLKHQPSQEDFHDFNQKLDYNSTPSLVNQAGIQNELQVRQPPEKL